MNLSLPPSGAFNGVAFVEHERRRFQPHERVGPARERVIACDQDHGTIARDIVLLYARSFAAQDLEVHTASVSLEFASPRRTDSSLRDHDSETSPIREKPNDCTSSLT